MLILSALMSAIFEVVGRLYSFCEFLEKKNGTRGKQKYSTFINSSVVIFERNMRVVIFWTMCHHLVTKKGALKCFISVTCTCNCIPKIQGQLHFNLLIALIPIV